MILILSIMLEGRSVSSIRDQQEYHAGSSRGGKSPEGANSPCSLVIAQRARESEDELELH